jgi:hypothetical protein
MNVNNRKLFANRDARRRLSEMGGIVASSPELLGAAQKFAPGGMVTPYERVVGQLYTMDRGQLEEAGMPRFPGSALGYLGSRRAMDMLQTIDPNIGPEEFSQMSPQERRDAGFSSSGLINQQYFDVRNNIMESQFPMQGPEMPEMPAEEPARLSPDNFVNPVDEFPAGAGDPFRLPELELDLERDEEERRRIAETFERQAEEEPPVVLEGPTVAETFEEQAQQDEDGGAVLSTVQDLERDVETSEDPVTTVSNRVIETAGMDPASTAEDRIRQYEEIFTRMFGQDDEAKRRERYMNLAMIGFAIAAGEDPSALKNIADGMLRGTEVGMENQRRQEARMDAARTAAVQAGLADAREERASQRAMDMFNLETARRSEEADIKFERDLQLALTEAAASGLDYENTPHPAERFEQIFDAEKTRISGLVENSVQGYVGLTDAEIEAMARRSATQRTQDYMRNLADPSRLAGPTSDVPPPDVQLTAEERRALGLD